MSDRYEQCSIHGPYLGECSACVSVVLADHAALAKENADLRDAIRLIVGREINVPWDRVRQSEVNSYLRSIRQLKRERT